MPLQTARASPSGELTSSVETDNPYSGARRLRISFAWAQNPHCSWVSKSTFIALGCLSIQSCTNISDKIGYRHIHRVLGSAAVIGPPFDQAIRAHYDKRVSIAARSEERRVGKECVARRST